MSRKGSVTKWSWPNYGNAREFFWREMRKTTKNQCSRDSNQLSPVCNTEPAVSNLAMSVETLWRNTDFCVTPVYTDTLSLSKNEIKAIEIIKIIFTIIIMKEMCSRNLWMSPGFHGARFEYHGLFVFSLHLSVLWDGTWSNATVRLPLFKLPPLFAFSIQDCSLHAYALLIRIMTVKSLSQFFTGNFSGHSLNRHR